MKRFIVNIFALSIVIIVISVIIEVLLLFKPNLYSYKKEYVEQHINDIECLLLGNSHIEEALDPNEMGKGVFNMAIGGRAIVYDVELAKMYVPLMNNLKVLIVPLDYTEFYFGRDIDNPEEKKLPIEYETTDKCMYYKYMNIRVDKFWYWSEILNSKLNFMTRFVKDKRDNIECDSLGYIPLELSERKINWKYKGVPNPIDMSKKKDMKKYDILYNQYVTIVKTAMEKNVRLVLLGTPMYKTAQKYMSMKINNEILSFVNSLQEIYPNIEYYNYSYDNRFEDDDYYDSHHLTALGAKKFSNIIKNEILRRKN
jgi:hypothetical protein